MRSVKQVKDGPDIVWAIGNLIELTETGYCYCGCCPFHEEATPSLVVNPKAGTWRCFGCDEGGDVHDFVAKYFGVPREEVVKQWREIKA